MAITETTKVRALREARGLLQEYGFNGFSFQHVADLLGIKKPSLYDHFKSKEVLGQKIVEDYLADFMAWTRSMTDQSPKEQVHELFEVFFRFACSDRKICPLSALVADINSIPKTVRKALVKACSAQREWLESVIHDGQKQKVFRRDIAAHALAETVMALALGSQLIARGGEDSDSIKRVRATTMKLLLDRP